MDYYPLFVSLRDQRCLVVGGGDVAARKARELLAAGARVTLAAPAFSRAAEALGAATPPATLLRRPFEPGLVADALLVIAATAEPAVNAAVAAACRQELRLCNVVDDGAAGSFIVPAVVDRSPVIVAVSSGGRAPVLARLLRQRLEQWLPARLGALAEWAGGWRGRARAALPALADRRAFWERLLAGPAAARALAGDEPAADALAAALLAAPAAPAGGRAWLVGAGPGDPGLITARGLEVLRQADVVLHDRLVAPELVAAARREAEVICVGKAGGRASTRQEDIDRLLVERVRAGARVVRLKGGDPFVFGRGSEEAQALAAAGLPFEVVPGVTAASGCGAYAGIPLTHRGLARGVTLATAHAAPGTAGPDWAALASSTRAGHTLALYMGGSRVAEIAAALTAAGLDAATPAALVIDGTTPRQRALRGTLADIGALADGARGLAPALLLVGATVGLAAEIAWRPADGLTIPGGATGGPPPPGDAFFA
jgi:uroporphyrin-III C-methyltransferase/precorrin-2 dehydrogenase/sirohydrochlorin ferrochelatase